MLARLVSPTSLYWLDEAVFRVLLTEVNIESLVTPIQLVMIVCRPVCRVAFGMPDVTKLMNPPIRMS